MIDFNRNWPEMTATILFAFAFIFVAGAVKNAFILLILGFLWGLMFGRLWYRCKTKFKLPWIIIILGFVVGFIVAAIARNYNGAFIILSIFLFLLGMWLSYKVHKDGRLRSAEY